MILFILFVIGLTVYAAKLVNATLDNADANGINQYRIEMSSVQGCHPSISCNDTFDSPVSSVIFAHCSNIHSGHARTLNRCMRLMYRYNPIAFLRNGKIPDSTSSHYLQSNSNVFCSVKLLGEHGFIRFRKLLI